VDDRVVVVGGGGGGQNSGSFKVSSILALSRMRFQLSAVVRRLPVTFPLTTCELEVRGSAIFSTRIV
jgi:hypothetical protein